MKSPVAVLVAILFVTLIQAADAQLVNSEWNTGSGDWNVATNWFPNDVPDNGGGLTYDAEIGNRAIAVGAFVDFVPEDGASDTITSLTVSGGADLDTNANSLFVTGQTIISGVGSSVHVQPAAGGGTAFNTDNLDINGGALQMAGGTADIDILLEINTGSITGHGLIIVGDADGVVEAGLENSANIIVGNTANAVLTLQANGVDTLDLDGTTELGTLDVSNVSANAGTDTLTLVVDGPLSDAFSGTILVGQRDTLTFNDDFTMSGADVQLDGGTQIATLNGPGNATNIDSSAFTINGDAVIDNNLTFTGPANTLTVNASGSLTLNGSTTSGDASFLSLGAGAELVVASSMTIIEAGGDLDWDGTGSNATTTISGGGHLSLTVDQVDVGNNIYNGAINLNDGGDLTVNNTINSWQAAGIISKNGAGTSLINGDEVAVTGDLVVNAGTLDVNAAAIFGSTSDVIIANGATADMGTTEIHVGSDVTVNGTLSLGSASVLEAATIAGSGLFRLNSTSTITGNAVVNTTSFDWDGVGAGTTHTINNGVVFTVNSTVWDADDASPGIDDNINLGGNGAQIVVNNIADWTMARTLNANTAAAGLATIGGTSRVTFSGASAILNVNGDTDVTAPLTFGADSSASVDAGFTLDAQNNVAYSGGTISGAGTYSPGTTNTVTVSSVINVTTLDFDGGNWTVNPGAILDIQVTDYDTTAGSPFDSTITLNDGDMFFTSGQASFVLDGTLNLNSTNALTVTEWNGEPIEIGTDSGVLDANVNVTGGSTSRLAPPVTFHSDADVDVAAGSELQINGTANFNSVNGGNNAEFTGTGIFAFNGVVNVNESTTLNMVGGAVDLDGADGIGDIVNIDAPLTINTLTMASFGRVNVGGGPNTLDVNNSVGTGVLTVNLDDPAAEWTLNGPGVMNLVNDNTEATLLAGSDVNFNGTVNVTGDVRTTARLDIAGVVNINTPGQPLRLGGGNNADDPNTLVGGTIGGAGLLVADLGVELRGFGTINTGVDFEGNLFADNGILTVNGSILDAARVGTRDDDGILNFVNPWDTSVSTFVQLEGGEVRGGTMTINNLNGVSGNGLVSSRLINNVRLRASEGTLVVQTAGNDNDWDGAGAGELRAINAGTLELRDVGAAFGFTGKVSAVDASRVFANGFALDFNPGSSIDLTESTYESTSSTDIGGTVTIGAGTESKIKVTNNFFLTFETGSSTTLNGNLRLQNNNINIESGATFGGTGALVIDEPSHAVVDNGATVNVLVANEGTFRPAGIFAQGAVTLKDYSQTAAGELVIDMAGPLLNQFDRVLVTGSAQIDGRLLVDLGGGFDPTLGTTYDILATGFGVAGTFDLVDFNDLPSGKAFAVSYLANTVRLTTVAKPFFEADFDEDGDVDMTDYGIWQAAYNLNQQGDANGDNVSNAADYTIWRGQLGLGPSLPGALTSGSVPEPSSIALLAITVGMLLQLSRQQFAR